MKDAKYQWYDCTDGQTLIQREVLSSYRPSKHGSYQLKIVKNGCTVFTECFNLTALNTDKFEYQTLNIYPNPVRDKLRIKSITTLDSDYSIQDMYGRIVQSGKLYSQEIDCSNLKTGLYTVVINHDKSYLSNKISKL